MTARYAVFGHPVVHSLSPRIHAAFGTQLGIPMQYAAIDASPEDFANALGAFAAGGGLGANVTLPHKERALALCTEASDRARRAGAANTLSRRNGQWHGDNTDGVGLVHDLTERRRLDLRGRRVLMLGAGGAARGVSPALLDAGIGELWVVNRTAERADALADALGEPGRVHTRYWSDLGNLGAFDMIINATSAGRGGGIELPFSLAANRTLPGLGARRRLRARLLRHRDAGRAGGREFRDLARQASGHRPSVRLAHRPRRFAADRGLSRGGPAQGAR